MSEDHAVVAALERLGLVEAGEAIELLPLTGGVSSDIQLVRTPRGEFCVKRALAQLKVAAVWEAPVERNAAEAEWLRTVAQWQPDLVPHLLGEDREAGLFAMAYLEPETHPVWKRQLLDGHVDFALATAMGKALGIIHQRSTEEPGLAARFANDHLFDALRIDPYLRATARAHLDLAPVINAIADRTASTKLALVHGDVSPKNILSGPKGPVLLDAECAWFGDPAFDLAFLLNHLLLKATLHAKNAEPYLKAFDAITAAYLAEVHWEAPAALEQRCTELLPALLLARIDGKSPVEYLTSPADKDWVRQVARHFLTHPTTKLQSIRAYWSKIHG
jgi:5-methylthioribose kinase